MIPSFLSNLSSSNLSGRTSLSTNDNGDNGNSRTSLSVSPPLSSSPSISHPLLRNQWAARTFTSSIVSPTASPLVNRYLGRESSSIADDHNYSNEREVFSIFSSLD